MALITYPLNDKDFDASDAELFHCTRSSGIFDGDDFACSVTGADNSVTVGIGIGWIRNSRFSGKVIALKSALTLDLGVADSTNPRIDAVVIQFDANANATEVVIKKGTPASSPAAPEVSRTEALYELHLCHVRREAGASSISVADVTDLRANKTYCGLMEDDVTARDRENVNEDQLPVIPIIKGGTEATTADAARKNLGAAAVDDVISLTDAGTAIPSGANMDDYLTPGSYYSLAGTVSETLINSPFSRTGFRMIVMNGYGSRKHQIAFDNSNTIKFRTYTSTEWVEGWGTTTPPTLKSLLAEGPMIMSANQFGNALPAGSKGMVFLVPVKKVSS